jgi:hypothetical protein
LIGAGAFVGFLLLTYLFDGGIGTVGGAFLGSFAIVVRICWPLRKQLWFWLTILVLGTLHVLALVLFDWSAAADWTGLTAMPLMAADIALLLEITYFIYRSIYGAPAHMFIKREPRYAEGSE